MSFDDSDEDLMMTMADEDKRPARRLVLNANRNAVEDSNSFAAQSDDDDIHLKSNDDGADEDIVLPPPKKPPTQQQPPAPKLAAASSSSMSTELELLLEDAPPSSAGSWSPHTPAAGQPVQTPALSKLPPRASPATASSFHSAAAAAAAAVGINHMLIPETPTAILNKKHAAEEDHEQEQDSAPAVSRSVQRPTTWSEKKKKAAAAAAAALTATTTPNKNGSNNNNINAPAPSSSSPSIPLAAHSSLSGASAFFVPSLARADVSTKRGKMLFGAHSPDQDEDGRTGGSSKNKSNNNLNYNYNNHSQQLLLYFIDRMSSAEEYRRLSIESRQNEDRCSLLAAFSRRAIRIQQQRQIKMESLEAMMGKWFRRSARYSDEFLEKKLDEANTFLEHVSQLAAVAAAHQQNQHQQPLQHHTSHQDVFMMSPASPRSPSLHSVGGYSIFALNGASVLEHTVTRERHGSDPPGIVGPPGATSSSLPSTMAAVNNGSFRFSNVQQLQRAVLKFAKNFSPVGSPPSAGQVRADGILADMSNWGPGDFSDMSFLTAPLVIVAGPRAGGKSSVAYCLTNKKPFFSTLPKVQPTIGIIAQTAQLKDVPCSTHARVTLSSGGGQDNNNNNNNNNSNSSASLLSSLAGSSNNDSAAVLAANRSFVLAPSTAQQWSESTIGTRVARGSAGNDSRGGGSGSGSSSNSNTVGATSEQVILKSSASLRIVEVPQHMISSLPPRMIPLSGFELALCFDITQDGTKTRRELASQFRQIVATVTAAVQNRGDVLHPVLIPVYLFATHVDKMKSSDRKEEALVGLLRDLRLWFKFVLEATVGANNNNNNNNNSAAAAASSPLSPESVPLPAASTTTTIGSFLQFYLVDVYAVSCQEWSVVGERPRSAGSFPEVAADLFRTMAILRPLTPVHIGAQIVEQFVQALVSYEDAAGTTSIDGLDSIRASLAIKPDCNAHVANEVAVRQVVDGSGNNSLSTMAVSIARIALPVPVRRIIVGVITFLTGIGRWASSCGYFVDYALFLRLVLQHVPMAKVLEDLTGLKQQQGDASGSQQQQQFDFMSKIFSRCMQYAFVDVLSYHGIVVVDEEEGFSSVVVGPQVFTRVVNCIYALQAAVQSARQLNVTEKAATVFNESKQCSEFPDVGKTDRATDDVDSITPLQLQTHADVMRDLTAWQFGTVTPFAWKSLLRGYLAPTCASENDFFLWCARLIGPLGFLEPRWSPGHIDFVLPPTSQLQHHNTAKAAAAAATNAASSNNANNSNTTPRSGGTPRSGRAACAVRAGGEAEPSPILISTMCAKAIHARSHQFLVASLTTADDNQQPATTTATFSSTMPVSSVLLPQAVLVSLLRAAACNDSFTMQDIALWSNCLCFSTYWKDLVNHHEDDSSSNNNNNIHIHATSWDFCCMILMHWDFETVNASGVATCRVHVAGASAAGSPKRVNTSRRPAMTGSHSNNNNNNNNKRGAADSPVAAESEKEVPEFEVLDVSSSASALGWIKREIERTVEQENPMPELRPTVSFRDGGARSASSTSAAAAPGGTITFSGIAQTAREILAGCSRSAADTLLAGLQAMHERTWDASPPLREVLQTLMMEERVGPVYPHK